MAAAEENQRVADNHDMCAYAKLRSILAQDACHGYPLVVIARGKNVRYHANLTWGFQKKKTKRSLQTCYLNSFVTDQIYRPDVEDGQICTPENLHMAR